LSYKNHESVKSCYNRKIETLKAALVPRLPRVWLLCGRCSRAVEKTTAISQKRPSFTCWKGAASDFPTPIIRGQLWHLCRDMVPLRERAPLLLENPTQNKSIENRIKNWKNYLINEKITRFLIKPFGFLFFTKFQKSKFTPIFDWLYQYLRFSLNQYDPVFGVSLVFKYLLVASESQVMLSEESRKHGRRAQCNPVAIPCPDSKLYF
jgi:hypothetical protein